MKMETNPQTSETDQEQRVSTSEEQDPRHARFYDCPFCKRGFSNAQALGGHMNIHRKDRAKLKQHTSESQLSLDITKKNPSDAPVSSDHHQLDLESTDEISCTLKTPYIRSRETDAIVRDQTHLEELQNQLLFFGTLPMSKELQSSSCTVDHKETKISSSHDSSQGELDLELRLGPEPPDTSAKGTKKFF